VIMYADKITASMQQAMDETSRRRATQIAYNELHGITPITINKSKGEIMDQTKVADSNKFTKQYIEPEGEPSLAADPVVALLSKPELTKMVDRAKRDMDKAAKDLDFVEAARYRDEMFALQKLIDSK